METNINRKKGLHKGVSNHTLSFIQTFLTVYIGFQSYTSFVQTFLTVYIGFQSYFILYTNLSYGLYWFPIILYPLCKPFLRFILVSNHTLSFMQTILTVYIGFQSYFILYTNLSYGLYWFPIILHPLYKPFLRFILVSNHTSSFIQTYLTVYIGFQSIEIPETLVDGYNFVPLNHPSGNRCGGVGIFYKKNLPLKVCSISYHYCNILLHGM